MANSTVNVKNTSFNVNAKNAEKVNPAPKVVGGGGGLGKFDKEVIIREAVRRILEKVKYQMGR